MPKHLPAPGSLFQLIVAALGGARAATGSAEGTGDVTLNLHIAAAILPSVDTRARRVLPGMSARLGGDIVPLPADARRHLVARAVAWWSSWSCRGEAAPLGLPHRHLLPPLTYEGAHDAVRSSLAPSPLLGPLVNPLVRRASHVG